MRLVKAAILVTAISLGSIVRADQYDGRRVALVIGNSHYSHALTLRNPINDANLIAAALRKSGFEVIITKYDLDVGSFRQQLRDFRKSADGASIALVYYAGHGLESSGHNWLIPTSAVLATERDLEDEAVDLDRVIQDISGATVRIAILDACRDNPFTRSWRSGSRALFRGLADPRADDVLVIFSAAAGQLASDGLPGSANSPFAVSLAQRLSQPGLMLQLLPNTVRDDVLSVTGKQQKPFYNASITSNPIYLIKGSSIKPLKLDRTPNDIDQEYWNACCISAASTVDDFKDYLSRVEKWELAGQYKQIAERRVKPVVNNLVPSTFKKYDTEWMPSDIKAAVLAARKETTLAADAQKVAAANVDRARAGASIARPMLFNVNDILNAGPKTFYDVKASDGAWEGQAQIAVAKDNGANFDWLINGLGIKKLLVGPNQDTVFAGQFDVHGLRSGSIEFTRNQRIGSGLRSYTGEFDEDGHYGRYGMWLDGDYSREFGAMRRVRPDSEEFYLEIGQIVRSDGSIVEGSWNIRGQPNGVLVIWNSDGSFRIGGRWKSGNLVQSIKLPGQ